MRWSSIISRLRDGSGAAACTSIARHLPPFATRRHHGVSAVASGSRRRSPPMTMWWPSSRQKRAAQPGPSARSTMKRCARGMGRRRAVAQQQSFNVAARDLGDLKPRLSLDDVAELPADIVEPSLHRSKIDLHPGEIAMQAGDVALDRCEPGTASSSLRSMWSKRSSCRAKRSRRKSRIAGRWSLTICPPQRREPPTSQRLRRIDPANALRCVSPGG
jgi:hypothetical protein